MFNILLDENKLNRKSAIQSAQLKQLYSTSNAALIASTLLAVILAFMQRDVTAKSILIYWLSAVIFVSLVRAILIHKNKHADADANANTTNHDHLIRFRFGVLVAGLVWGSAGIIMFPADDLQHQLFLIFMLAGLSAGSVISYSADLVSAIVYSLSVITPILVRLMLLGNSFSLAMSISVMLYLGVMIVNSRHNYLSLYENIILRLDAIEREQAVRVRNEWHQAILEGTMDGFWLLDTEGYLLEVNNTYCQMSGYSSQELLSMHISELEAVESIQETSSHIKKIMEIGEDRFESKHRRKDGSCFDVEISVQYRLIEGEQLVVFLQDITERKQAAEEIESLAYYDPLTHLPNRRMLIDHIKRAMALRMRTGSDGAILFLDLDHFKTLNDTFGHAIGDMLLQQVAERLTTCLRESDTIARLSRLGGDEFVVLLEDLSSHPLEAAAQAEIVGEKIHGALNRPYQLATHEYKGTASIGVALFSDHESSKDDLLKHADIAMYQAKKGGRNGMCFFDPYMQVAINSRANLERELELALVHQQFQLQYQMQVDYLGHVLGAEALVRWIHPERGLVTPFHFIPLAEETGLILPIGQWVLDTACTQLKIWQLNPITQHLTLSINVSAKQFHQRNFVAQVIASLQRHDINPKLLKLELTESMLLENIEDTIATMVALGNTGLQFSLDDFGTGYSSLQYLKRLPLHQLKIDQSFIRDIVIDSSDKAIVRTIIAMAKSLNLEVIAEGVENDDQLANLTNYGCKYFQGYLFGKPLPIDEFEALLSKV
jgi:diguanylate cyclase (GGDEF)-like protein/PAS domain S-box-containing protein